MSCKMTQVAKRKNYELPVFATVCNAMRMLASKLVPQESNLD